MLADARVGAARSHAAPALVGLEMTAHTPIAFDNSYARLPERFRVLIKPTPVSSPRLIRVNEALAWQLNIDTGTLRSPEGVAMLAGNQTAPGSEPLAMAYAGHQFGGFSPQLGDGRAILLGEVISRDGIRRDIQLKGSGPTPFSRRGDGRAALGPVLREYIVSEAFAALGISTTRSLAAVLTGDYVVRETPQPGAVLTRVASSHVRVGTFQYFAARGDADGTQRLADYVISRHYPDAADAANPYRALLDAVIERQARLIAQWMHIGFIHGVMNTDNMSIAGETIDFGPCAFMDTYDPAQVYSSIDHTGRYAYANQPPIAQWNLTRLAETLVPLLSEQQDAAVEQAQAAINAFPDLFEAAYTAGMRRKLGLLTSQQHDLALGQDLLSRLATGRADFTNTFRQLCDAAAGPQADDAVRSQFANPAAFDEWAAKWRQRLAVDGGNAASRQVAMRAANPAYIPRNHRVEEVIRAAVDREDFGPFEALLTVLSKPYDGQPENARFATPPAPDQLVHQTFCGT
jgi:serine/tyrosine/threonine adenylyltransferase